MRVVVQTSEREKTFNLQCFSTSIDRRAPVEQFDDHAVGVADLERAFTPRIDGEWHGDRDPFRFESGEFAFQVLDGEREDHSRRVSLALVFREYVHRSEERRVEGEWSG